MTESEYLKIVRHTVAALQDFGKILRVSNRTSLPQKSYGYHCHDIFEIRLLFGLTEDSQVDYQNLQELRLSPAGILHPGLPLEKISAHMTIRFSTNMLDYLRSDNVHIGIGLDDSKRIYGVNLSELLEALNAFCSDEFTDVGHLQLIVARVISSMALYLEHGNYREINRPVELICNFIHENYYKCDLSMVEVAAAAGLSSNYMQKVFRSVHNCTPLTYLKNYRLEIAKQLLRQKKYQVKEVAMLCGWNYPHYFDACYKQKFGHSPKDDLNP